MVLVNHTTRLTSPGQLAAAIPQLLDPKYVMAYAQLANHLAQLDRFELITDVAEFEAEYRAQWNEEDPEEVPLPGVNRLRNYGLPDFSLLARPVMVDGVLTFFAVNTYMGVPYRATLGADGAVQYEPVAMAE